MIFSKIPFKLFVVLTISMLFFSCKIEGYKISREFDDIGNLSNDPSYFKYISPNKIFSLNIPLEWEVQEDFTDSIYGIFIMDTASFSDSFENFQSLAITKHSPYGSLKKTFKKELSLIKKNKNEKVLRIGKEKINGIQTYWMLTESIHEKDTFCNLTYFTNKNSVTGILLLQVSVYKTHDYISKITNLLPSIHSFRIN